MNSISNMPENEAALIEEIDTELAKRGFQYRLHSIDDIREKRFHFKPSDHFDFDKVMKAAEAVCELLDKAQTKK